MFFILSLSFNAEYADERFRSEIAEPLAKRFPHVHLEHRREIPLYGDHIEKWENGEPMADIHLIETYSLRRLIGKHLCVNLLELDPSLSAHPFEAGLLAHGLGDSGELFAVPYNNAMDYPLCYNKTIFDKFGEPYPGDGMTWEEVIERSADVSGPRDGTSYIGLDPADISLMSMQLSAELVDAATGKASVTGPEWKKMARTIQRIYQVKNNLLPNTNKMLAFNRYFVREQVVAMGVICPTCYNPDDLQFDWDIVSYPVFEERQGPNLWNNLMLAISPSCKDKAAALEIVRFLVSDEFQRNNCRKGVLTSLNNPDIQMMFGELVPLYQNKNVRAISYNRPAPPPPRGSVGKVIGLQLRLMKENKDWGILDYRRRLLDMILNNEQADETLQRYADELNREMGVRLA
ncbi:extracellular solute-binding protein [Paenibacillus hamazuiensis]|uniref:extracellular solute-binding protein n=1 Tax=Paenibacillus hamazuiensis TaxID=2936508 RepID=UPI00200D831A